MSRFRNFYLGAYQDEHRHPVTIALHVVGTIAGVILPMASLAVRMPWLIVLYPVVHAAPGLLGHRFFERNAAVGDVRITRKDYPIHWFIAANHLLLWDVVRAGLTGRSRAELMLRSRERHKRTAVG